MFAGHYTYLVISAKKIESYIDKLEEKDKLMVIIALNSDILKLKITIYATDLTFLSRRVYGDHFINP